MVLSTAMYSLGAGIVVLVCMCAIPVQSFSNSNNGLNHVTSAICGKGALAMASSVNVVEAASRTSSASSSASASSVSFEEFDYKAHWYPVSWAQDVPYDKPTQVTLFDVDYVISRVRNEAGEDEVMALLDRCPHKSASLSEGRVSSSSSSSCRKYFQCAYHGWTFDGKSGRCVDIPQVTASSSPANADNTNTRQSRADGTAVPAMIQQGMVWMFPGGSLEEALLAPLPPTYPGYHETRCKSGMAVRDFPVDWSILIENIMDPDHGLFAHQTKSFDLYSASKDNPQSITEQLTHNGKGWTITSRVNAVEKLIPYNRLQRITVSNKNNSNKKNPTKEKSHSQSLPLIATTNFYAPSTVIMARRSPDGSATSQIIFFVSPTGTGRSRFHALSIIDNAPITLPRWFTHVFLNNFLDQDTHLLISAQKYILDAESKAAIDTADSDPLSESTIISESKTNPNPKPKPVSTRKSLFLYRSPSEKLQSRLGTFFDQTLSRAPNRSKTLFAKHYMHASLLPSPPRHISLDRYQQHTKICPDSLDVVRNCDFSIKFCNYLSLSLLFIKAAMMLNMTKAATATAAVTTGANTFQNIWMVIATAILRTKVFMGLIGVLTLVRLVAKTIQGQFFYAYPEQKRDRDMAKIPSLWADPL